MTSRLRENLPVNGNSEPPRRVSLDLLRVSWRLRAIIGR